MARRSDHSRDEIRTMAVQAAARIVARQGLEQLKLRAVARAIGYAPGTLYNVFDGPDEMMLRVNWETLDRLVEALSAVPRTGEPRHDVKALLAVYGDFVRDNANRWRAVFDYTIVEPARVPGWYVAKINEGLAVVERAVGAAQGGPPPAVVARVLWAGLHGIFGLAHEGNLKLVGAADADRLADAFVDMVMAGLAPEPAG